MMTETEEVLAVDRVRSGDFLGGGGVFCGRTASAGKDALKDAPQNKRNLLNFEDGNMHNLKPRGSARRTRENRIVAEQYVSYCCR